jgi:hypothetical protein
MRVMIWNLGRVASRFGVMLSIGRDSDIQAVFIRI